MSDNEIKLVIEAIPEPRDVRARLGQALRETKILRQLLKVSERAAREREERKARAAEVGHAA